MIRHSLKKKEHRKGRSPDGIRAVEDGSFNDVGSIVDSLSHEKKDVLVKQFIGLHCHGMLNSIAKRSIDNILNEPASKEHASAQQSSKRSDGNVAAAAGNSALDTLMRDYWHEDCLSAMDTQQFEPIAMESIKLLTRARTESLEVFAETWDTQSMEEDEAIAEIGEATGEAIAETAGEATGEATGEAIAETAGEVTGEAIAETAGEAANVVINTPMTYRRVTNRQQHVHSSRKELFSQTSVSK